MEVCLGYLGYIQRLLGSAEHLYIIVFRYQRLSVIVVHDEYESSFNSIGGSLLLIDKILTK